MKISIRFVSIAASMLALASLTACVQPQPVYQTGSYQYQPPPPPRQGPYVEYGRIANIEVIQSQSSGAAPTGVGAVAGGVLGGVLGHQVGNGRGNTAATIAGAVGGALVGNAVETNNNAPKQFQSFRVSVQTDSGAFRAFDVPSPGDLRIGDRVRIDNGQISRF